MAGESARFRPARRYAVAPMTPPPPGLGRAAALGLAGGLGLAALALLGLAAARLAAPCESPAPAECALQHDTDAAVARLQGLGALGCALVATGAWRLARRA